jgi:hypothetical protein
MSHPALFRGAAEVYIIEGSKMARRKHPHGAAGNSAATKHPVVFRPKNALEIAK